MLFPHFSIKKNLYFISYLKDILSKHNTFCEGFSFLN